MTWILAAALVTGSPEPSARTLEVNEVLREIAADLPTGTLLFSQGDCLAVRIFSRSRYTHVALVVVRNGVPIVFDSNAGSGVTCRTIEDYIGSLADAEMHVFRPNVPFSRDRAARFENHLESQLGREYSIRHHLTGKRAAGVHCAEYATEALVASDLLEAERPSRVSPASLVQGVLEARLYDYTDAISIAEVAREPPAGSGWCGRLWFETKECSSVCYRKMRGWFCCK